MLRNLLYKLPTFSFRFSITTPPADRLMLWQYVVLGALVFISCYYGLASYAILDMNEGLYAEVAREMLVYHHYIIPHVNNVPFLEKPPLFYWLLACSYRIFGVNDFAARVVPSTITALMCLSFLFIGKKTSTVRAGWVASIILLSSLVFLMIGRVLYFDMLLTLCITLSMFSFYFWYQERRINYLYLMYIFLALATLSKGLLSLIIIPLSIIIFLWLMKAERATYKELFDKRAVVLFLILVLPWHVLGMVSNAGFSWEYFFNGQILRYFNAHVPPEFHTGPIYYYLPRVIAYLVPWSLFLPFLFPWPIRITRPFAPLPSFLWIWFVVSLIFFSAAGDKGNYYMVVGAPPLAYLIAMKIDQWLEADKPRMLMLIYALVIGLLLAAGIITLLFYTVSHGIFASEYRGDHIPYVLNSAVTSLVVFILVYGAVGGYLCYKNASSTMIPFLLLTGLIIPNMFFYLTVKERLQIAYSQQPLAKFISAQYESRPVFMYKDYEALSSFVYYFHEPVVIVDSISADLHYGATTDEGKKQFISLDEFLALAQKQPVYIIMRADKMDEFLKLPGTQDFCPVQRNVFAVLMSNAAEDCHATIDTSQGQQKEFNLENVQQEMAKKQQADSNE